MNASDSVRGLRRLVRTLAVCTSAVLSSMIALDVRAQLPAVKFDVPAATGQVVTPIYEGWYEVDGTKYVLFSYFNRNLEETVNVPIGPQNSIQPGPPDQGQPTRFFPGIHYGVFAAALPKDRPKTELNWTLTANGQTQSIPTSLDPLYLIAPQVETGGTYPGNTPPTLKFDPAGASAQGPHGLVASRTGTVSRPVTLDVWVADDGLPPVPRRAPAARAGARQNPQGLTLSWQVYRGPGAVKFSDPTPAVEQGTARTTVTFSAPGEYMLHLLAIDSRTATRCCWTNGYVRVTIQGDAPGR